MGRVRRYRLDGLKEASEREKDLENQRWESVGGRPA